MRSPIGALVDAERLRLPDLVVEGMNAKGHRFILTGRSIEGRALVELSLRLAEGTGSRALAARSAFTLALAIIDEDPRASVEVGRQAIELARRAGLGPLRLTTLMNTAEASLAVGDWSWIEAELDAVDREELEPSDQVTLDVARAEIAAIRGRDTTSMVDSIAAYASAASDPQVIGGTGIGLGLVAFAEGRFEDAMRAARGGRGRRPERARRPGHRRPGGNPPGRSRAGPATLERLDSGGWRGTAISVHRAGLAAALAALDGSWPEAAAGFSEAWRRYRDLRLDVALAVSALDCLAVAPAGDALAELAAREARSILEREGAAAYLVQLERLVEERSATPAGTTAGATARPAATPAAVRGHSPSSSTLPAGPGPA